MPYDVADFKVDPLQLTTPRARLEYLRDFLRALPDEKFNIAHVFTNMNGEALVEANPHACGTAACILGWSMTLFGDDDWGVKLFPETEREDFSRARRLFMPLGHDAPSTARTYTRAKAVVVLDHLIRTGEVDWSVAPSS